MYSPGDCVLIETNFNEDGSRKAHLFVIILAAETDDEITILIPMDKIPDKGYYNQTTKLNKGDHDFVKIPTYMNYYEGIVRSKKWIDKNRLKKEYPPIEKDILQKICSGITTTEDIRHDTYDTYLFRKK